MSISRYSYVDFLNNGNAISNSDCVEVISRGIKSGLIDFDNLTLAGSQRLDVIAGQYYGDSSFWWVIAAASGIGWSLQLPPGTFLRIPTNLEQVFVLLWKITKYIIQF